MMLFKRVVSFLLTLVLLVGMVPPVSVRAEETEPVTVETTAAVETTEPTEATEPTETTEAIEETAAPTEAATESAEETTAPTEAATEPVEETTAPTEAATEPLEEATAPTEAATEPVEETTAPTVAATEVVKETVPEETVALAENEAAALAAGDGTDSWILQDASGYPESAHNYANDTDKTYTYTVKGATALKLTFSSSTQVESGYDYIYLYDGSGTQVGKYTGTALAGQTVVVDGSTVKIRITSDDINTYYGFSLSSIYASIQLTGTCGTDVQWDLYGDTLTIYGSGAMTDYTAASGVPWYSYRTAIRHVVISSGVTSIGKYALYGMSNMTEVTIPVTVTSIGSYALQLCSSVTEINLPDMLTYIGEYAFQGCFNLTAITIPEGVTAINGYTFQDCYDLETVTLPDNLSTLGYYAFDYCCSLKEITIPGAVPYIGAYAFQNCSSLTEVSVSDSMTSIGTYAFSGCTALGSFTFPAGITEIKANTFLNCKSLTELTIPENVASISSNAFNGCTGLTRVTLSEGLTTLSGGAFRGCTGLKRINIPSTVTGITRLSKGISPFYGCSADLRIFCAATEIQSGWNDLWNSYDSTNTLTAYWNCSTEAYHFWNSFDTTVESLVIPECVTWIPETVFDGCTALKTVTIPETVTYFDNYAFRGCSALEAVVIPSEVTAIGASAFQDCSALAEVTIPDSVTYIGLSAFQGCAALTELIVPVSVTYIGVNAFSDCTALGWAYLPAEVTVISAPSSEYSIFYGCERSLMIFCGADTRPAEWDAYWNYRTADEVLEPNWGYTLEEAAFWRDLDRTGTVVLPADTARIPSAAFYDCDGLTAITIPESVTSIGTDAFSGCDGLTITYQGTVAQWQALGQKDTKAICTDGTTWDWGSCGGSLTYSLVDGMLTISGEGAMADYTTESPAPWYDVRGNITAISLGQGITGIGSYAFYDCDGITGITIPAAVTKIGENAFRGCGSLTAISVDEENTSYAGDDQGILYNKSMTTLIRVPEAISGSCVIPDSVTTISASSPGSSPFYGCDPGLVIHCSVASHPSGWGKYWNYCSDRGSLAVNVVIPEGTTSVPYSAFENWDTIISVTIPDSVTTIGSNAFSGCTGLKTIYIPAGVTTISASSYGYSPFYGCDSGLVIYCGAEAKQSGWGSYWNYRSSGSTLTVKYGYTREEYDLWSALAASGPDVVIPEGITEIPNDAFRNCKNITSVSIPDSVTTIGSKAFYGCDGLTGITLPDSVTTIGSYAFAYCDSLTTVDLGEGVTTIGSNAFSGCTGLKTIYIPASVTTISASSYSYSPFYGCDSGLVIYCGAEAKQSGWDDDWNCYRNYDTTTGSTLTVKYGYTREEYDLWGGLLESGPDVVIPEGITEIPDDAFWNCKNITSVTIPDSVTTIGSKAFYGCDGLTEITIPDSVTTIDGWAFFSCDSLTTVDLGEGVTTIDGCAFYDCDGLTEITIPDSVTSIGNSTFYDCDSLTTVDLGEGVTTIGSNAFYNCNGLTEITIPASVTSIGSGAFRSCDSLTGIRVDAANTAYAGDAYGVLFNKDMTTLIQAPGGLNGTYTVPDSVTTIGDSAFKDCDSLTEIVIPDSVTTIGSQAFSGCTGLKTIYIPASVTTISASSYGDSPFYGCSSDLVIYCAAASKPSGWGSYWNYRTYNSLLTVRYGYTRTNYEYLSTLDMTAETIVIPEGMTMIPADAFKNCDSLTQITIPDSVTSIGNSAFYDCDSLTEVTIPDSVTSIGSSAFSSCDSLTTVDLGEGVTTIGSNAFYNCDSLTEIVIPDSVTTIGSDAFYSCDSLTGIWVDAANTAYASDAYGVLFNKAMTTLIRAPGALSGIYTVPDSVTTIGSRAFAVCTALQSINIPKSVTSIAASSYSSSPFYGCSSDMIIYCSAASKPSGWGSYWNYYASGSTLTVHFGYNTAVDYEYWTTVDKTAETIVIPEGVTMIPADAFENCDSLTEIVIPDSVTSIGSNAFYGCDGLTEVTIPASVTTIGSDAFAGCESLTGIWVDAANTTYASDAYGVLFNKAMTTLIQAPCGLSGSYMVPDGVATIRSNAFENCTGLTVVYIPGSVTTISASSYSASPFYGCSSDLVLYCAAASKPSGWGSYWNYYASGSTLTVHFGYPTAVDYEYWTTVDKTAETIVIPEGVTMIPASAFYNCDSLTQITIPDSVTSIGNSAFYDCDSLTTVDLGEGVTTICDEAFRYCDSLTEIVIPDSVTTIGDYAFHDCDSLTTVDLGEGVTTIGSGAFYNCDNLTEIVIPDSVITIGDYAFYDCGSLTTVDLGEGVTTIGDCAFSDCYSLTEITIPNSVTSIGSSAFRNCYSLTGIRVDAANTAYLSDASGVLFNKTMTTLIQAPGGLTGAYTIPDSITTIGSYAFYSCDSLTEIVIPDSVTTIDSYALANCDSLTEIVIPDSVATIGSHAFAYCDSLTTVDLGKGVTTIGDYAFIDCYSMTQIVLPDSVTTIGDYAFYYCDSLTGITIPDSVTTIGDHAFYYCDSLTTVDLGEGVTTIGSYAFAYCDSLTEIVIPASVTTIGDHAFYDCDDLTEIVLPASVTSIGSYAFSGCDDLTVRYSGTMEQWQALGVKDVEAVCTDGTIWDWGSCGDDLTYSLVDGTLTISGTGAMTSWSGSGSAPWYSVRESITAVSLPEGITGIGDYGFYDCDNLTQITIPAGVTSIGSSAFDNCGSLTGIWVDAANTVYASDASGVLFNKTMTTLIRAPGGLTGDYMIPDSVTTIENRAFTNNTALKSVYIPESVTTIPASSYYSDGPFYGCNSLIIYCAAASEQSGWGRYWDCRDYNYWHIVKYGCTKADYEFWSTVDKTAERIVIPEGVTMIPAKEFKNCTGLKAVYIPESVTTISASSYSNSPFYGCDSNLVIYCAGGSKGSGWGSYWNYDASGSALIVNYGYTRAEFDYWTGLDKTAESITIQAGMTRIPIRAFYGFSSLSSITIPEGVTEIGSYAFYGCTGLKVVYIPESVTAISGSPFYGCTGLKVVYIPESVTTISASSYSSSPFYGCDSNMVIYCGAASRPGGWGSYWNYRSSNSTLTVNYGYTREECAYWTGLDKTAESITIPADMTRIPSRAFYGFSSLSSITIPDGVTKIGDEAFYDCDGLKSVYIPESVTTISGSPFYSCDSNMVIYCGAASRPGGWNSSWNYYASGSALTVKYGYSRQECDFWFTVDKTAESIVIPDGITFLPAYAFSGCTGLTAVTIPDSVTQIRENAFKNCTALTHIYIPESVTNISASSYSTGPFYGCDSDLVIYCGAASRRSGWGSYWDYRASGSRLTVHYGYTRTDYEYWPTADRTASVITIPDGVTLIPANAYAGQTGLDYIYIPDSVQTIPGEGSSANAADQTMSSASSASPFVNCAQDLLIFCEAASPDSKWGTNWNDSKLVSYGYSNAEFAYWSSLNKDAEQITVPDWITRIPNGAFRNFSNLEEVVLPEGLTEIGDEAFYNCDSLRTITIPENVQTIGDKAFGDCLRLEWISFTGSKPELEGEPFAGTAVTVYFPAEDPTWTEEPEQESGDVTWVSNAVTQVQILRDGENVTGKTLWLDLNAGITPVTFSAGTLPETADDTVTWLYEAADCAVISENAAGTITLTPSGTAGTVVLTAEAADGSGVTGKVTVKILALSVDSEEIGGEDPADVNLFAGKSKTLKVYDQNTGKALTSKQITWSMNPVYAPYATLTAKGKLTAKKVVEKVRIEAIGTIIGSENTTVTVKVDIYPAVTQVEVLEKGSVVNGQTLTMDFGEESRTFTVQAHPLDTVQEITWSISDAKKLAYADYTIDGNALTVSNPTGKSGTVTVKATVNAGVKKTVSFKLNFANFAEKVEITNTEETLTSGESLQLNAVVTPFDVTKSGVTWSLKDAADKAYASISSKGVLKAKTVYGEKDVTVVATTKDGLKKAKYTVTILPKDAGMLVIQYDGRNVTKGTVNVDLNKTTSVVLTAENFGTGTAETVEWKSSKTSVATVENGTVTFLKAGTVTITAAAADGRKATVTIAAAKLAGKVTISGETEVASGKSITLKATVANATNTKVTWSITSGDAYAKISSSGKLTAAKDITSAKTVTARATAKDGSGTYGEFTVTVRPVAQGVQIYSQQGGRTLFSVRSNNSWWVRSNTTLEWAMNESATLQLSSRVYPYYFNEPSRNAIQGVDWKSSSSKIATVDENGLVTCIKPGTTTITATAKDGSGKKVTFKLKVINKIENLSMADQTVTGGKSLKLAELITIDPGDATNKTLTWEIAGGNGAGYVTLSAKGVLKTKKVQNTMTVKIRATARDGSGESVEFTVTITP